MFSPISTNYSRYIIKQKIVNSYVVEGADSESEISLENKSLILNNFGVICIFLNKSSIILHKDKLARCNTIRRNVNLITQIEENSSKKFLNILKVKPIYHPKSKYSIYNRQKFKPYIIPSKL